MKVLATRPLHGPARAMLAGLALVVASSWGRYLATGALKVDESYPSRTVGTLLFALALVGWTALMTGWAFALRAPPARPRALALAGMALASLMLPALSNDVFSVMAYGTEAAAGHDVYTSAAPLAASPWLPWVGERWATKVCVYGPTTLWAATPSALGHGNPWLALFALRLTWAVPILVALELSLRATAARPAFGAFVWCNPLVWVEGVGQLHADVLGMAAVAAGIALALTRRPRAGWLALGLAILGKYTFVFASPWFWLEGQDDERPPGLVALAKRAAAMLAILGVLGAILYAPLWAGPDTLLEPVRALGAMNPGGSIVEVVGILAGLALGLGVPDASATPTAAVAHDRATYARIWLVAGLVTRLAALLIATRLLAQMLRDRGKPRALALPTGALVVCAATIASHRFQSWYLLAALPFFGLSSTPAWRKWWVAAIAAAVSTELVHLLPRDAALFAPWTAVSNGATVVVFLAWARERFFGATVETSATSLRRVSSPAP